MNEQIVAFLQSPTRETYWPLRQRVVESEAYAPYSCETDEAGERYERGDLDGAVALLRGSMPNLMLSPQAHQMLAFLSHEQGDEDAAEMEMYFAHCCLAGITSTGDGSRERPYVALRTSDEYDVLTARELQLRQQSLHEAGDRRLDQIACEGGEVLWFDITDAFARMTEQMGGQAD